MDVLPAHLNRDSFRDSFKGLVALEIIIDLPIGFPINNIISLQAHHWVTAWRYMYIRIHTCTRIHTHVSGLVRFEHDFKMRLRRESESERAREQERAREREKQAFYFRTTLILHNICSPRCHSLSAELIGCATCTVRTTKHSEPEHTRKQKYIVPYRSIKGTY